MFLPETARELTRRLLIKHASINLLEYAIDDDRELTLRTAELLYRSIELVEIRANQIIRIKRVVLDGEC